MPLTKLLTAPASWRASFFSALPGRLLLLGGLALAWQQSSFAQTVSVWNESSDNWSNSINWSPTVPVSGLSTGLSFGGASTYTANNDLGTFTLNQLQFSHTFGTVTITGGTLNPARDLTLATPSIRLTDAGSATVSSGMTWGANAVISNTGSGTLLLNGAQTFTNGNKITYLNAGSGTITLADAITYSNSGNSTAGLVLNLINNNSATSSFNIGNLGGLGNVTLVIGGTGTVRFSGDVGGDMLSGSAIVNVLNGATFDLNGNGETFGGFMGSGTIRSTVAVTGSAAGYYSFSGKITGGAAPVSVNGANQTLILSGTTSDYTGSTSVLIGRLIVSASAASNTAGPLGKATSDILVGDTSTSVTANASLLSDTAGVTIGRNVRVQTGSTGLAIVGGLNTSGTVTYSGNIILGSNSAAAKGVVLTSAAGGTVVFSGNLQRATSATGSNDTVTLNGAGTVVLSGTNNFTGATKVNSGTLVLDYTTNNTIKLNSTAGLTLSGGSLSVIGSGSAGTTTSLGSLALGNSVSPLGGGARLSATSGSGQSVLVSLGAITRNVGTTVDFSVVSTDGGAVALNTSTTNAAAGILGGHATFNQSDWATVDGSGNITALGTGSYSSSFGIGFNTSLSSGLALPSGGTSSNTLRLTAASAITFNSTTPGSLTLDSGGLLMTASAGASSIGTTTTRGTLATGTGELIIHQNSTAGALTIHSVISGSYLTKSGEGSLVLTGTNTFTGGTMVNGGSVTITNFANLGALTAGVTLNGGTLVIPSGTFNTTATTFAAAQHPITLGSAGGTLNLATTVLLQGGGLTGTGTLIKTGTGTLVVGSSSSTFTGDIIINNGTLMMNSNQLGSAGNVTVNNGGTYEVNDDATAGFGISSGSRFVLNGNGYNGNGALRVTDQSPNSYGTNSDPRITMANEIYLQTTARIQVENAALVGSASLLTLTNSISGAGTLVKSGNGTLVVSARNNTYTGGTKVENGILRIDLGNDRLPTDTTVTLGAGTTSGMLQLNGYSQSLTGLATAGTGTGNAVLGGSSTSTSVLRLNAPIDSTYTGLLGGTGIYNTDANNNLGFVKEGNNTLTLAGANTHTGSNLVAQGTLRLGHANALGFGGTSLGASDLGTTVAAGATLDLNGMTNVQEIITLNGSGVGSMGALVNNSPTPASVGSGVASLNVTGSSASNWSAASTAVAVAAPASGSSATASAQLGITNGSLSLTSGGSGFTLTSAVVTVGGGSGAAVAVSLGVTNASYTVTPGTTTYSVAPTVTLSNGATGVANLDGTGRVTSITVTSPGSSFVATPSISFTGGTVNVAGTNPTAAGNNSNYTIVGLNVINAGSGFTSPPTVSITGGTGASAVGVDGAFVLNGLSMTNSGSGYTSTPSVAINGTATATANLTSISLASDSSIGGSGELTVNAVISGDHMLTKVGTGVTILTATNTYTGTTQVNEGTLQVGLNGVGSLAQGSVVVNGPTAVLAGSGTLNAFTTNVILGMIKPGDQGGAGIGTLHTQTLHFVPEMNTQVAELQIQSSSSYDQISITGDLSLNGFSGIVVDGAHYTAAVGDSFTLLDWSGVVNLDGFSVGANFRTGNNLVGDEGNLDLPDITGIGYWQISSLLNGGALTVTIVVPEPTRGFFLLAGCASLLLRRRRQPTALV